MIYVFGHTRDILHRHGLSEEHAVLEKPFTGPALLRAARDALKGNGQPGAG